MLGFNFPEATDEFGSQLLGSFGRSLANLIWILLMILVCLDLVTARYMEMTFGLVFFSQTLLFGLVPFPSSFIVGSGV